MTNLIKPAERAAVFRRSRHHHHWDCINRCRPLCGLVDKSPFIPGVTRCRAQPQALLCRPHSRA